MGSPKADPKAYAAWVTAMKAEEAAALNLAFVMTEGLESRQRAAVERCRAARQATRDAYAAYSSSWSPVKEWTPWEYEDGAWSTDAVIEADGKTFGARLYGCGSYGLDTGVPSWAFDRFIEEVEERLSALQPLIDGEKAAYADLKIVERIEEAPDSPALEILPGKEAAQ